MKKKIIIIGHLDGFANSVRPEAIKKFLEKNGYSVRLFDDNHPSFLRAKEAYKIIARRQAKKKSLSAYYQKYPFIEDREAFAETLLFYLQKDRFDALICSSHASPYIFNKNINALTIYDCPAPIPFELKEGYEFTKKAELPRNSPLNFYAQFYPGYIRELKRRELEIYKKVDCLCFHWQNYADYLKQHFYHGHNIRIVNWGCSPRRKRAQWASNPKILFVGNLGAYWINKKALSSLTQKSPYRIDCYGKPRPEKYYHLNYKSYLANMGVLNQYQFGLVALTYSRLKKFGFSAKVLEYVSYGLPALLPKWHTIKPAVGGCIYYDTSNFVSQVEACRDRKIWKKKSDAAYDYAQRHSWDRTLQPLLRILNKSL
jgi:hypothetical protein